MGRAEERKADYKKGIDFAAGRRRREDTQIQLRKSKKEEQLAKRRSATNNNVSASSGGDGVSQEEQERLPTLADIPGFLRTMQDASATTRDRLDAVRGIRRMTSVAQNPPVRQLLESGVLPVLVRFLGYDKEPMLQFETAWAITNVASTEYTLQVVEAGATPGLIRLLECPTPNVREQAAWCLGNIAGDCPKLRDFVLTSGALPSLLKNIENPSSPSLLKNVVWVVSNLCRGKPPPELVLVKECIPAMVYTVNHPMTSDEAKMDALWTLSYLTDGTDEKIQAVLEHPVVPFVMSALQSGKSTFMTPAIRILGNIVTGNAEQTQVVLDAGIMDCILPCLQHARKALRKESAWLLSNICAGTSDQISAVFEKKHVVPTLVDMSCSSAWEVRKEAIWAVSNMFCGGSPRQVATLVELDGIESMVDILDTTDSGMVLVALDAIKHVLQIGKENGKKYNVFFDECDGIDKLETLQHHTDKKIYEKAVELIDDFFGGEEADLEEENLAPSQSDGFYAFGLGSPTKNLFGSPMASQSPAAHTNKFDFGYNSSNMTS